MHCWQLLQLEHSCLTNHPFLCTAVSGQVWCSDSEYLNMPVKMLYCRQTFDYKGDYLNNYMKVCNSGVIKGNNRSPKNNSTHINSTHINNNTSKNISIKSHIQSRGEEREHGRKWTRKTKDDCRHLTSPTKQNHIHWLNSEKSNISTLGMY